MVVGVELVNNKIIFTFTVDDIVYENESIVGLALHYCENFAQELKDLEEFLGLFTELYEQFSNMPDKEMKMLKNMEG